MPSEPRHIAVLGAGPTGLTAALTLLKAGYQVTVLERSDQAGGLCGTRVFQGQHGTYRFDYGGHRFITRNESLLALVQDLVGDELLLSSRSSVIRLDGRTYQYPLALGDLLRHAPVHLLLGALKDLSLMLFRQRSDDHNYADWIRHRFGPTLYRYFFSGYTEKLWGIPPDQLSADWAAQRISLMDLKDVAKRLLHLGQQTPRTYARRYRYPKYGFGQLFENMAKEIEKLGGSVKLNHSVTGFSLAQQRIQAIKLDTAEGQDELAVESVISTLGMPDMVRMTGGESALRFRALRFLNLPVDMENVSPYTWQYLSDAHIVATRLQEPKRRSPYMAPKGKTSLMLEIPCQPGDATWTATTEALMAKVRPDLAALKVPIERLTGECFTAYADQAYPVLDIHYPRHKQQDIQHLSQFDNLLMCGRQGSFRYIFSDTAMEMGQMAAQSVIDGTDKQQAIYEYRNEQVVIEAESVIDGKKT